MRRAAAAAAALAAALLVWWFAPPAESGIRLPKRATVSQGFNVYYWSDSHAGAVVGGQVYGMELARAIVTYINADDSAAALMFGGDLTWYAGGQDTAAVDSLLWEFQTNLGVPFYPTVGNWEWTHADTGTGTLYNQFTSRFPEFYAPYVNASNRGRRWYGERLRFQGSPTNVLILSMHNVAESAAADYRENNPDDGSGITNVDFDGIKDSTSAQRVELRRFIQGNRAAGDWVFAMGHRTERGMADISNRPDLEDATTGQGIYKALDDLIPTGWILFQGDEHLHALLDQTTYGTGSGHWTISAVNKSRDLDRTRWDTHAADVLLAQGWEAGAGMDTTYCGGCALEDSLGVAGASIDAYSGFNHTYTILWKITPNGSSATVAAILFQYADATVQVFSYGVTQ